MVAKSVWRSSWDGFPSKGRFVDIFVDSAMARSFRFYRVGWASDVDLKAEVVWRSRLISSLEDVVECVLRWVDYIDQNQNRYRT